MKKDWEVKALGEVIQKSENINPGQNPEKEFIYVDVSSVDNQSFSITETTTIKGKDAPSRARKLVKTNDIIFATVRPTLKRIAIIPSELNGQVCSTGYFVLRAKEFIDYKLIFYFLQTDGFNAEMQKLQKGASYPAVTDGEVRERIISYPKSLPEQQRIVAILDEAFAAIGKAKANAETNLQNARALFDSYLQSVFANPGDIWEMVKLSELATDITDGDHMPPPKSESGVPFITISNINKKTNKIDFSDTFLVSPEYYKNLKVNRKPKLGDVLYTVTGSFGIPVIVESDIEFCFQRHIGLIRPKSQVNSKWLYYLILSPQVFKQGDDGATGAAQRTVSLNTLRNFTVPKVSLPEQQSIVTKLDVLSAETKKLEAIYRQKLTDLDELKKAILQKAFRGELSTTQGVALCD